MIELSHCIILLQHWPTKKSSVTRFTKLSQVFNLHFLMVLLHGTLPSGNLLFEFCGISSNFRAFWAIFLGSIPMVLQSDIGPSSLRVIPGSDRYNSVLFFELLNSRFTYAEGAFLCNFVLKSNQVYTKYSPRFLQAPFKWRFPIFH